MSDTYTPGAGLADELDDEEKALFEGGGETEPAATTEEPAAPEAPAAEAKPEEPVVDEDGLEPDDVMEDVNKGRFIRHGAFHRERKMRQEIEKQLQAERAQLTQQREERARIDERLQLLMQMQQQQRVQQQQVEGQPQQVPNPEEDPFGYMRYLEQQISSLSQQTQGVTQQFQAQDEYTSIKTAFQADANAFTQRQPDFLNAYQHLMRARDRELMRLGRTNPQERAQIVNQEEQMIVGECLRNGKSPSELIYELAKDRGYAMAQPEPAQEQAPVQQNGLAQRPSAAAQVAAIAKGQGAAKSLGTAAGGSNQPLTAELLASMSDAEFDAVYSKMSREQRKEYFGG
jgi:hypothetical protein